MVNFGSHSLLVVGTDDHCKIVLLGSHRSDIGILVNTDLTARLCAGDYEADHWGPTVHFTSMFGMFPVPVSSLICTSCLPMKPVRND